VLGVSASTIRQQAMQQQPVPAKLEDETEIAS